MVRYGKNGVEFEVGGRVTCEGVYDVMIRRSQGELQAG